MKKRSLLLLLTAMTLIAATWLALALFSTRTQSLDDHVRAVAQQLKCPVCQEESVADSPSWIAGQMRITIRQQIEQGRSDQEIMQYFESRYGPEVLWGPQRQGFAMLAWLAPLLLLILGVFFIFLTLRDWRTAAQDGKLVHTTETTESEDEELSAYREQLERELAAEDALFAHYTTDASPQKGGDRLSTHKASRTEAQA